MTSISNTYSVAVTPKLSIQKPALGQRSPESQERIQLQRMRALEQGQMPISEKQARIDEKIQLLQMTSLESGHSRPDKPLPKASWTILAQPKHPGNRDKRMKLQVHSYVDQAKTGQVFDGIRLDIDDKTYYISDLAAKTRVMVKGFFALQKLLNGNRFEYRSFEEEKQVVDENWSGAWKDEHEAEAGETYRHVLYPAITSVVSQILPQDRPSVVLEVCGGDGELAGQILQQNEQQIAKYHLLDANRASCETAIRCLEPFSYPLAVSQQDITRDYTTQIGKESVDLALGCGALTKQVLANKEQAMVALKHIHTCLREGGILLLTGATASMIDAADLEQAGFIVTNRILPTDRARSFYIAIKRNS